MQLRLSAIGVALVLLSTPAWADDRAAAKNQVEFGIRVAQNGLWKEAREPVEKAVELDPTYAQAWNNLAIATSTKASSTRRARPTNERSSSIRRTS